MEPVGATGRHKRMFVDIDAIRALGTANAAHADALADVAVMLSTLPTAPSALGAVGNHFISALAAAAAEGSRAVAALSGRLSTSTATAYAVAEAYDEADSGAGSRLTEV